jgi:glucose/arabinose dehydrogenase
VIDAAVENFQALAQGVLPGAEVVVLNSAQDGIEQITQAIAARTNITTLDIVSYGNPGRLQLGSTWLDLNNLSQYSNQLQQWTHSLTADADILLYGCNVAATSEDLRFVQQLSHLTGADVAASSDLTGNANWGGDWDLEVAIGAIESSLAFDPEVLAAYEGVFDSGTGLKGEYFDNIDFTNLKLTRTDPTVNFNWRSGSPNSAIGADTFSVRWTGQVQARFSESYTFYTSSDDGIRLWVNGQQIINQWVNQAAKEVSSKITLVAGQKYDIKLEYFENTGNASSKLSWSSASQVKQIIPQAQLFNTVETPPVPPVPPVPPSVGTGNGLKGEYFDNIDLTAPKLSRIDGTVNFNWGNGSPDASIGVNTFSARWTGQVQAQYNETYTFYTSSDDGARLWVNGQQVINRWVDQGTTEVAGTIALVAGQKYDIRLEYFENGGSAVSKLSWSSASQVKQIIPQAQLYSEAIVLPPPPLPVGTGNGLKAEYFDEIDLTVPKLTRIDGTVNFNWGTGSPDVSIGVNTFSARWTGQVQAQYSETYTFYTSSDDGARLWVNGQQLINRWVDQGTTEVAGTIALVAGQKYDIRLEYFENGYDAVAQLSWSSASQVKQIIPQTQLYTVNPGTIGLAQNLFTVNENDASVAVTVVRTGGSDGVATIDYTTVNATAIAGQDYTTTTGRLTFANGETSKTLTIPILNNSLVEATETFNLSMDATSGAALGTSRTAIITIIDDDGVPTIDFDQPNFNVTEAGGTATITLRRSGNTNTSSSVRVSTSNGTALADSDYTAATGTVTFAIGETSKTFTVPILNDTVVERNETLNLTLSNVSGAVLTTQPTATMTIADNDPGEFIKEAVITGLNQPTAFDWSPDGSRMYVAQKNGIVRVAVNGILSTTPFVDISIQVNDTRDRGLLGLAVHPDFLNNPYVYLLFTYDPPEAANGTGLAALDGMGNRPSRLIRVTANADTNYTTAIAGSEVVLLGTNSTWANTNGTNGNSTNDFDIPPSGVLNYGTPQQSNLHDYLATDSESHTIGFLQFGLDGSLFVSNGDGASYGRVDPRATRVQDIDNLSGKILRIDPMTGHGLADNPFYNNDATSNRSKVYNYGLRNPFRFTISPTTGEPVIGDVGWNAWEEINTGRGKNFGWPYYEGANGSSNRTGGYSDLSQAQAFYTSGQAVAAPLFARSHSDGARAIVMGDFYTGTTFPNNYDGALFVGDVNEGTIDALFFDQTGQVTSSQRFASNVPYIVQITMGKDSSLYYANLAFGEIGRWRYA